MLETIVFVGATLCIQIQENLICQNTENIDKETQIESVFTKTVTDWQKIPPETNYNIEEEVKIEQRNIDYLIILSWNLKNEIINQEKQFRNDGGKFIVPFPKPKILA